VLPTVDGLSGAGLKIVHHLRGIIFIQGKNTVVFHKCMVFEKRINETDSFYRRFYFSGNGKVGMLQLQGCDVKGCPQPFMNLAEEVES
jgi:hypothetical protein